MSNTYPAPLLALAARKRIAAENHERKAAQFRQEADELVARADRLIDARVEAAS